MDRIELPQKFLDRMKNYLGAEYELFLKSYSLPAQKAVRVNNLKISVRDFVKIFNVTKKVEHDPFSFYTDEQKLGLSALHHAGLFYIQEPSATAPVNALDIIPGQIVVDVCAAPGGKSTQIAALLENKGLLVSNEKVQSRAMILASNIERMGIKNCVVTNMTVENLAEKLSGIADRLLVDAPCSGEGMFRKNPEATREWSEEHVRTCAKRQLSILLSCSDILKNGGIMVYSTCTFSREENEEVIEKFLSVRKDFSCEFTKRIYPHEGYGEGHFYAKLHKNGGGEHKIREISCNTHIYELLDEFWTQNFNDKLDMSRIFENHGTLWYLPEKMLKIQFVYAGVRLGEIVKQRFEPNHALYMSKKFDDMKKVVSYEPESRSVNAFLRGESFFENAVSGYCGVCAGKYPVGFGKVSEEVLKNHYPKGLRNLK